MKRLLTVYFGLLLSASMAFAFSGGPPDGTAGDPPGNNNCSQCHNQFGVNSGDGSFMIEVLNSEVWTPGETYEIQVTLSDPDQSRWGFELTVLDDNNAYTGTIQVSDADNTQTSGTSPTYIKQTSTGTYSGESSAQWTFDWIAPEDGTGSVTFYAAGNAADNNGSTSGDYIYTTTTMFTQANAFGGGLVQLPNSFDVAPAFPNPFNSSVKVGITLPEAGNVHAKVFDMLGREVATIANNRFQAGHHFLSWQPSGGASGIYFLQVSGPSGHSKMLKLNYMK